MDARECVSVFVTVRHRSRARNGGGGSRREEKGERERHSFTLVWPVFTPFIYVVSATLLSECVKILNVVLLD